MKITEIKTFSPCPSISGSIHSIPRTRLYVWPKGETILENLANRHQRPYTTYKKVIVPEVLRRLGITEDVKVRWSSKCGCTMCPCSPGFFIDVKDQSWNPSPSGWANKEIHVTIAA